MARITLASRLKAAPKLAALLQVHGAKLAAGMDDHLASFGVPSGQDSGLVQVLERLRSGILQAREELAHQDERTQERIRATRQARKKRDEVAAKLRDLLVRIRCIVEKIHDKAESAEHILGMTDHTSRDPVVLLAQAERVRRCLEDWDSSTVNRLWTSKKLRGVELDSGHWDEALGEVVTALDASLEAVSLAKAHEKVALLRRKRAATAFDKLFCPASRWVTALGELAGTPALASLVSADAPPRRQRLLKPPITAPTPQYSSPKRQIAPVEARNSS